MATANYYDEQDQQSELERQALLEELQKQQTATQTTQPYEVGGITGGQEAKDAREQNADKPDYTKLGQYANKLGGYDMSKFDNPYDQLSEKYRIGLVQSHFDPRQGVTPDFVKALNDAGIYGAQFSGSGDQLNVNNAGGYARFGKGGTADVVKGLKGNNDDTTWGAWYVDDNPQAAQQGYMPSAAAGGPSALSTINSLVPTDTDFYNKLQQQLVQILGGSQAIDREALLKMLGAK